MTLAEQVVDDYIKKGGMFRGRSPLELITEGCQLGLLAPRGLLLEVHECAKSIRSLATTKEETPA
jgi:hypothetical protein